MRTDQNAILLQSRQVSPHGCGGDPQSSAKVGSGNGALSGKDLSNAKSTFFCKHECPRFPGANRCCQTWRTSGSAIVLRQRTICIEKSAPWSAQSIRNKQLD